MPAAFVKTWARDITDDMTSHYTVAMPFHLNDIDVANVVYGISSLLLTKVADTEEWFDSDIQMIYENTTNLIAWMIHSNFSDRRDLAMPYYPSLYNFYWFTSRIFSLLQTHSSRHPLPHPLLLKVKNTLSPALRSDMTADLLKRAKPVNYLGIIYFQDFMGIADGPILGVSTS